MQRVFTAAVGVFVVTGVFAAGAQQPAQLAAKTTSGAKAARSTSGRSGVGLMPGTRSNIFTTIQGNALTSTNGPLADTVVRLRDVRFGRIIEVTTTDKSGLFAFRAVDPGSYVVELIGNDLTILAASQILYVDAGQAVSTVVKLPYRLPRFGGLLGPSMASAAAIISAAAASGVLAVAVTGSDATPNGKPTIR
jgi:hypothetical protein